MASRDLQAPHRKRIEHLRARMHRDKDGQLAPSKRKGLVDDPAGVGGTVLALNDRPLAGVTVSIDKRSVRTDRDGRFELTGITPVMMRWSWMGAPVAVRNTSNLC